MKRERCMDSIWNSLVRSFLLSLFSLSFCFLSLFFLFSYSFLSLFLLVGATLLVPEPNYNFETSSVKCHEFSNVVCRNLNGILTFVKVEDFNSHCVIAQVREGRRKGKGKRERRKERERDSKERVSYVEG